MHGKLFNKMNELLIYFTACFKTSAALLQSKRIHIQLGNIQNYCIIPTYMALWENIQLLKTVLPKSGMERGIDYKRIAHERIWELLKHSVSDSDGRTHR